MLIYSVPHGQQQISCVSVCVGACAFIDHWADSQFRQQRVSHCPEDDHKPLISHSATSIFRTKAESKDQEGFEAKGIPLHLFFFFLYIYGYIVRNATLTPLFQVSKYLDSWKPLACALLLTECTLE